MSSPASGRITIANGKLTVPDHPVVPFIEGDGTGPDIWRASVRVLDAAVAKAYAELTAEGWLESRQGLGLFVAAPRQRLSQAERDKRFDEAVTRFVHDVVALDLPAEEVLERLGAELQACAPRKTA